MTQPPNDVLINGHAFVFSHREDAGRHPGDVGPGTV